MRPIHANEPSGFMTAVDRYKRLVREGSFMPTIAGGVDVGELHVYLQALPAEVGYFLGGALTLHPGGPVEGAKLAVEVVEKAIALKARYGDEPRDLDANLKQRIEKSLERFSLNYVPPSQYFK